MSIKENVKRAKTDYDEVYEAGRKSQYDEFWDSYQDYGNRTDYGFTFGGFGWNEANFKPKYDITPVAEGYGVFYNNKTIENLEQLLANCGVKLDFSKCTYMSAAFNGALMTHIPKIEAFASNELNSLFANCIRLVSIRELALKDTGTNTFTNTFQYCRALTYIVISGVIGNDIDFKHSTSLSKASIESIITHLSDTASGKTVSFSKTAVNNAFTTEEWNALIATKSNWTISLV